MGHIIGNDCTAAYFTPRARRRGYSDKMRDIVGDKNISADQIIILEKIFAMM